MRETRASLAFLENEAAKRSEVELRQAVYELIKSQKRQEMLVSVREDYAFQIIDEAKPSDRKNFVRPRRALMPAVGTLFGVCAGLAIDLWIGIRRTKN